jgi:hypothetical protein
VSCPFCDSREVECISQWAGQMITAQMRCRACHTYFEAVRDEFDAELGESDAARAVRAPDPEAARPHG